MTHITSRSAVSIFMILAYVPALPLSILLTIRHGLTRSSGWRFLIAFVLARLLAASFQLATIAHPTNTSLYIAEWVLLGIALSPLELASLGLLSRILSSINRAGRRTPLTPRHIQLAQLLNTVGLALAIVGGVKASHAYTPETGIVAQPTTKVGVALFIVTFCLIVIGAAATWPSVGFAEAGEKRVLAAIAATAPFLLVRVVYTAISTFDGNGEFNPVFGSVGLLAGMALVMELVIVYVFLGVGLTLKKVSAVETKMEAVGYVPAGRAEA